MSRTRLTIIGVATAILLVTGCAGSAGLALREFPMAGKRRAVAKDEQASQGTRRAQRAAPIAPEDEPSLLEVLDDVERIKDRDPSEFAVLRSAVEDRSRLFPTEYQQTFTDQMLGMAVQQQSLAAQPLVESSAASVPQPAQVFVDQEPVAQAALGMPPVQRVVPARSTPAIVAPLSHSTDAGPARSTLNTAAARTTAVTAQVSDVQLAQALPAVQPLTAAQASPESATAVEVVAAEESGPGQWNRWIEQALASLSADLARPNLDRGEKARLEIMRRLLYVATNQRENAVSPIEQLDEDEREYWKHQIHALLVSIDADGKHPTTRRAALALRNLRTATDHLANVSTLDVRSLTFCKEVLSYGEYRMFDSYSFRAKDEVVLYVEVDNFATHPRGDSFETELHSSYEIVDDAGRRVANVVLPVDKQVSNNRRRDYFIAYLITMPSQIASGSYRLRLTVEDIIGKKSNHATVDFRIQ